MCAEELERSEDVDVRGARSGGLADARGEQGPFRPPRHNPAGSRQRSTRGAERMRQLRALCAALLATVWSVGAQQLAPQEDPAAFINELDLQQGTEHVYLELAIRKHGFHPAVFDVDPATLRVQFFSAGRHSFSATAAPVLPVTTEAGRSRAELDGLLILVGADPDEQAAASHAARRSAGGLAAGLFLCVRGRAG